MTALDVATDGECPDRYRFPICTIALYFPEALLSPSILYLRIQPVAASYSSYAVRAAMSFFQCRVVAVFLQHIYNTAMDNVLEPSLLPTLSPAISEGMRRIALSVRKLLLGCEQAHQVPV